ncbi:MAG TPA: UDP-galactopyranose mutase, partial [Pirellula sp.]|nr:UDP-galactopyranose mutase [Pirellula sp.]
ELCNFSNGELPYAGRDFIPFVLPCKQVFPGDVRFCHYTGNQPFTRIVEYKRLTYYEAEDTLLVMEIPSKNNKLYPYMVKKHLDTAKGYIEALPKDVYSIGRLGIYKYTTIEQTLCGCFALYKALTSESVDGMEKEFYQIGDTGMLKTRKSEPKPQNF